MAWHSKMMIPLRVLIDDQDPSKYSYSDQTIQRMLTTAASYVIQEVRLDKTYAVNFETNSISPDPSCDDTFCSFVVMKAACLKNQWDFNAKAVSQTVRARCGPVSMETTASNGAVLLALVQDGFCAAYKQMQKQHNFGNVNNVRAVLNVFSHADYEHGAFHSRRL